MSFDLLGATDETEQGFFRNWMTVAIRPIVLRIDLRRMSHLGLAHTQRQRAMPKGRAQGPITVFKIHEFELKAMPSFSVLFLCSLF